MEKENAIRQYCILEHVCYNCFQEDPQDLVKLFVNLCHICDKDKWNSIRTSLSKEDLLGYIQTCPKEWKEIIMEELKTR